MAGSGRTAAVDHRRGWAARIAELLRRSPKLLATSVFDILRSEGFEGSYPTVSRHLNVIRGPRFQAAPAASVPIETAPGEECQFDFSDVAAWTVRWGPGEVSCFQAILCWSPLAHDALEMATTAQSRDESTRRR